MEKNRISEVLRGGTDRSVGLGTNPMGVARAYIDSITTGKGFGQAYNAELGAQKLADSKNDPSKMINTILKGMNVKSLVDSRKVKERQADDRISIARDRAKMSKWSAEDKSRHATLVLDLKAQGLDDLKANREARLQLEERRTAVSEANLAISGERLEQNTRFKELLATARERGLNLNEAKFEAYKTFKEEDNAFKQEKLEWEKTQTSKEFTASQFWKNRSADLADRKENRADVQNTIKQEWKDREYALDKETLDFSTERFRHTKTYKDRMAGLKERGLELREAKDLAEIGFKQDALNLKREKLSLDREKNASTLKKGEIPERAVKQQLYEVGGKALREFWQIYDSGGFSKKDLLEINSGFLNPTSSDMARKGFSLMYTAAEAQLRGETGAAAQDTEVRKNVKKYVPTAMEGPVAAKTKKGLLSALVWGAWAKMMGKEPSEIYFIPKSELKSWSDEKVISLKPGTADYEAYKYRMTPR